MNENTILNYITNNSELNNLEKPKKIIIIKEPFSVENGLLTPNSSIFFIDDKEYQDMKSIQYYIKCESYKYL